MGLRDPCSSLQNSVQKSCVLHPNIHVFRLQPYAEGLWPLEAPAGAVVLMGRVPTAATSPAPPGQLNPVTWFPPRFPEHPTKEAEWGSLLLCPWGPAPMTKRTTTASRRRGGQDRHASWASAWGDCPKLRGPEHLQNPSQFPNLYKLTPH